MSGALPPAINEVPSSVYLESVGVEPLRDALDDVTDLGNSAGPPPPQEFVLADYIPADCVTSLYAKGGSSKSFLALILGMHVVRGEKIFDREIQQGNVLYLDSELDERTALRRAWMIANGLGIDRLPNGLYYHRLPGSLTDKACNDDVRRKLDRLHPRLVIIDSFTAAVRGKDSNSLDDVSERLRWLDQFGTVLMIDHTPKSADIGTNVTAFGSVAKQIFARSALFIASNGKASVLRHEKSNFGPLAEPVRFALNFSPGFVTLEAPLSSDDPRLHGIEGALPARERIKSALLGGDYGDGITAKELAEALDLNRYTVNNALGTLKAENMVRNAAGKWYPVVLSLTLLTLLFLGNGK